MTLISAGTLAAGALAGCSKPAEPPKADTTAAASPALVSGIDTQYEDSAVRAQDDFYRHVNGKWLDTAEIPADKAVWGAFTKLDDDAQANLKTIIEAQSKNATDEDGKKIAAIYSSFMDEDKLDKLGAKPLDTWFAKIDAVKSKKDLPAMIAELTKAGVNVPYVPYVHQDNKDSTKYVVDLYQAGLGLPDRDYYIKDEDAKLKGLREQYEQHVEKMLGMIDDKSASKDAKDILALETGLAKAQWSKVENRDPVKTYNKFELAKLDTLAPGYDWKSYLTAADIDGKVDYLIVSQPSYITGFDKLVKSTPLPVWKVYLKWHVLHDFAPYLSKPFVDESFAFYGTALRGVPQNRPRWKRGVSLVEDSIGEGLGKLYVAKYFPPENKARMEQLVQNLLKTYRQDVDKLDWMSEDTKKQAKEKLAKLVTKIGYPDKWRDYSKLEVSPDDLIGNVVAAQTFEYNRNINKLGKPIDRGEWEMTPQTVNAYYNPEMNEIVFPAAILQPPFFNAKADDAVNYGGIGAVIGHEISHGFDDQGSQYDADGNLRDWWTKEDHEKFKAKTEALVAQYDAYEPIKGYHVNGKLTLGENIADNSGLAIAYKAYQLALDGKPAPVIDGMTGDQRFYMGWAQVWRAKVRENEAIRRLTVDPHSPPAVRGDAALRNQPAFFQAFDVKDGDKMYLSPEQRVIIW